MAILLGDIRISGDAERIHVVIERFPRFYFWSGSCVALYWGLLGTPDRHVGICIIYIMYSRSAKICQVLELNVLYPSGEDVPIRKPSGL